MKKFVETSSILLTTFICIILYYFKAVLFVEIWPSKSLMYHRQQNGDGRKKEMHGYQYLQPMPSLVKIFLRCSLANARSNATHPAIVQFLDRNASLCVPARENATHNCDIIGLLHILYISHILSCLKVAGIIVNAFYSISHTNK